jgi:hypothetical protein
MEHANYQCGLQNARKCQEHIHSFKLSRENIKNYSFTQNVHMKQSINLTIPDPGYQH